MADKPAPAMTLLIDDEHPLFDQVLAGYRHARNSVAGDTRFNDALLEVGGCRQKYSIQYVGGLEWSGNTAHMTLRFIPHGKPEPIDDTPNTTNTEGDKTK